MSSQIAHIVVPALVLFVAAQSSAQRPAVVDFHTHLNGRAAQRIDGVMRRNGIEMMVNLSGGNLSGGLQRAVGLQKALQGRVVNFYNPDWDDIDAPDWGVMQARGLEIAVTRYGYRGLKISKALGLYVRDAAGLLVDVDDERLDPLWAKAGELGVPVAIHTSDPKAFWEPVAANNERYAELAHHPDWSFYDKPVPSREALLAARDRVLDKHAATVFVCVHFGNNPEDLDYVRTLLARYPNAMVDVAARVPEIGRHDPARVRRLFIDYQDRIVFGTDIGIGRRFLMLGSTGGDKPTDADADRFYATHWRFFETRDKGFAHMTPIQGDWTIDAIGLPDAVLQKIYRGNARALLGLER